MHKINLTTPITRANVEDVRLVKIHEPDLSNATCRYDIAGRDDEGRDVKGESLIADLNALAFNLPAGVRSALDLPTARNVSFMDLFAHLLLADARTKLAPKLNGTIVEV